METGDHEKQNRTPAPDGPGGGTEILLDEDAGLGMAEWERQETVWRRLNPLTAIIRAHHWLDAHGVGATGRGVRRFVQRGRRGWADEDLWDLDGHLAGTIAGAVEALRHHARSHPIDLTPEAWDDILARITDGFRAAHDVLTPPVVQRQRNNGLLRHLRRPASRSSVG